MPHNLGRSTFEKDAYSIRPLLRLETSNNSSTNAWATAASIYLGLPGLRGYWPLTAIDGSGNYKDLSGGGLTLTNNNSVGLYTSGLRGFAGFALASSKYLSRADEATFDITGAEGYVTAALQGITIGAWVNPITLPSATMHIASKWNATGNQRSYALYVNSSNRFTFAISDNGTNGYAAASTVDADTDTWYFVAGRYITATPEVDLWVYGNEYVTTASVPASIYSGTSAFTIGSHGAGGDYLNAYACHVFLCAAALPDDLISALYRKTKGLFGF